MHDLTIDPLQSSAACAHASWHATSRRWAIKISTLAEGMKIGVDHERWSGFGSRGEMMKSRRNEHAKEMRRRNEAFCATFPAPGNCNPNVPVLGHPGVRRHNHHRTGFHAPLL